MLTSAQAAPTDARDPLDDALSPLLEVIESATARRSRIPVLSLWKRIPFIPLLASNLHLRWPGAVSSLPLNPRIGIFPFFASDAEILSRPLYGVATAQSVRQQARKSRASSAAPYRCDLYPDWEQAVDRRRKKLQHLVLPASSYICVDRVTETGDIKPGHRKVIGRFAPRGETKPQLLVPARCEITRPLVRAFDDLDLVLVNAQSVRGKHLASSIEFFLTEISDTVPLLIIASSPADLIAVGALAPPSKDPVVLNASHTVPTMEVKPVNRDRAQVERQFCFAIENLAEKSDLMARVVSQAQRAWWATRQSMSAESPREAVAFDNFYSDMLARTPGCELELLEEARRLIVQEAGNSAAHNERRNAVIQAALHDTKARTVLILVRSDAAAEELRATLAGYLDIRPDDLSTLGVDIINVFGAWPLKAYDSCVAAGYFGTSTIDMVFAAGPKETVFAVDPIESRIGVWDLERRFCEVAHLPGSIRAALRALSQTFEAFASPTSAPISLSTLSSDHSRPGSRVTMASQYLGKATYVCVCFADGSSEQFAANARFEVLGRKRLQLQTVAAKDLEVGDQVVLLNDDERAVFSDKLLHSMDEGRFRADSQIRSTWITTLRAVHSAQRTPVSEIHRRLDAAGIIVDPATVRTWIPNGTDSCLVPDRENVFIAFAQALEMSIPTELLSEWFASIDRLRVNHRRIGRALVRAIRGNYLGRLDPVSAAKMEQEWGIEAKKLLEAARVAIIDDVIPLAGEPT